MKNKGLSITLIANIIAFAVNIGINFFLTPFVVSRIGSEAYGFYSLAGNFTSYAQILTVALNSMAGRFITIAITQKDYKSANEYFNSIFVANIILSLFLIIPMIIFVGNMENIININYNLINDVKILFILTFAGLIITLIGTTFSESLFAANRLDIQAKRNIESYILKALTLVILYVLLKPYVSYMGIATLVTTLYVFFLNIYYTKKLLPEINVDIKNYRWKKIKTVLSSGLWNSVNRFSVVLSDGLDLLITNLFIDSTTMGVFAIAKTIPNLLSSFVTTIAGVFAPGYTIAFANNNRDEFLYRIRVGIIILSIACNVVIVGLTVIGKDFFSLWVPQQNSSILQMLSILTLSGLIVHGGVQAVYNIFTVVNKVKMNAVITLITSIANIILVFVLLKYSNMGVYAVAMVSSITCNLRNLLFAIPYAAYCIEVKKSFFYKPVVLNIIALVVSIILCKAIKFAINIDSWLILFAVGLTVIIVTLIISFIIITNMKEKKSIINFMKYKLRK